MRTILCTTLIDITETNVIRGESLKRDQHRNWQTVLQVLGLKTQPDIVDHPISIITEDVRDYGFGSDYQGAHAVWIFGFRSANYGAGYSIEELRKDFDEVPIILGLTETARMILPLFFTHGTLKNIYCVEQP